MGRGNRGAFFRHRIQVEKISRASNFSKKGKKIKCGGKKLGGVSVVGRDRGGGGGGGYHIETERLTKQEREIYRYGQKFDW